MKRALTCFLGLVAACAPVETPARIETPRSQVVSGPEVEPETPTTPPALQVPAVADEPAEDLVLGPVTLPNPARRATNVAERRTRTSSVAANASPRRPDLGGRVDSLAMLSTQQAAQVGLRRVARVYPAGFGTGQYTITLNNTGSGWQETFLLQVPRVSATTPAPLLVCFHKFGVSQNDILNRTTFFAEARTRGWYCIAPLGATQVSFSSLESQVNVRAAIEYVTSHFTIDRTRVYGAGFSMGGGSVTSYAGRHLDPSGVMFAAIANHTGGVALPHTYANEFDDNDADDNQPNFGDNLEVPDILDFWYGGPPQLDPFAYLRCSMMDLDPVTNAVAPGTDMSRNLAHVPVLNWLAAGDPFVYLWEQTDEFFKHVQNQNAQNTLVLAPGNVHSWSTLDETAVCNWLAQFTLQVPTQGDTLADDGGAWFHMQLVQDAAGAFTPFHWVVDAPANRFALSATENLRRLTLDMPAVGLRDTQPVRVEVATADATGDEVELQGFGHAPSSVTRDGAPATAAYDAPTHTVRLVETDAAPHVWIVNP